MDNKTCGECRKYKVAKKFWCLVVAPDKEACDEFEPKEDKTCGKCKYYVAKKGYCRLLGMVDICYSEDACGVFEAANAPAESKGEE